MMMVQTMKAALLAALVALALLVGVLALAGPAAAAACDPALPGASECSPAMASGGSSLAQPQFGGSGLMMFDYSMGYGNSNDCFSCRFAQDFLLALSSFSAALFMYFRAFFVVLAPLFFATWLGYRSFAFFASGSDDGPGFVKSFVGKLVLFAVLWMVMMAGGPASRDPTQQMSVVEAQAPWSWFGPEAVRFGFAASGEVRTALVSNLTVGSNGVSEQIGFNCRGVARKNPTLEANPGPFAFAYYASEMVCATERLHIVGMAISISMIEGAFKSVELISWNAFYNLFTAVMIAVFGLILFLGFAVSAVWFVFLVLDVVVKFLILAGIAPVLMAFAFFGPTRQYLFAAVRKAVGSLGTVIAIGFIQGLTFYLIANTVSVYNGSFSAFDPRLQAIPLENTIADLREFVRRVQLSAASPEHIPITIAAPWFFYLFMVSALNFVLGKKVIALIEGILGTRGTSEMANSARQMAMVGGAVGLGGAVIGAKFAGKAGLGGLGLSIRGGAAGLQIRKERQEGKPWKDILAERNPFGKVAGRVARDAAPSLAGQAAGASARVAAQAATAAVRDTSGEAGPR